MDQHSNVKAAIAYDDLREWLSARRAARRSAQCIGRELAGRYRARRRGGAARRERAVRGVRRHSRLPEGLSRAAEHVRRHAPQHDARLSRSPDQMGTERRLSRGLSDRAENHSARDRRGRSGAGKRAHRRRRRSSPNFRRRSGTRRTAAAISAPAPTASPAIRRRTGSTPAPTARRCTTAIRSGC